METQLNLQDNLLERGTYKNLADLKQQITLFAKQMFNDNEDEIEEEDLNQDDDFKDDDLEFDEENDDDLALDNGDLIDDEIDEDDDL